LSLARARAQSAEIEEKLVRVLREMVRLQVRFVKPPHIKKLGEIMTLPQGKVN